MSKLRIGIIGSKFAARLHAEAYLKCHSAELYAAASPNREHVEQFGDEYNLSKTYTDYRHMLDDASLDLVSVCVPNFLHKESTLAAAERGVHVVCEKPLATTVADAEAMVSTCADNGVKLMYAEDWLFAPALQRAKHLCEEGAIGKLLYLKAKESHSGSHSIYAQKIEYCGGGALIHLGIHPIGFARWFVGEEVTEVTGHVSGGSSGNLLHEHFEGEDWGSVMLTFANGVRAQIDANYITYGGIDDQVEIYGSTGNLRIDLTQSSPIRAFSLHGFDYATEKSETTVGWTRPTIDEEWTLGYPQELAHFVDCVRDNREPMWGARGEDGLEALRIVMNAYESAKTGKKIREV
ncbi:MAG: Gfo/Idh/MocA family oxidoreductase [Candidatus Poribacteria bacterium]|nr:Gfo/Idh/MocA family oxidoreductase [Candidatus Poribacteria bacterium]